MVADRIVVARPTDGQAVALNQIVADVWRLLSEQTTVSALEARLSERYPSVSDDERRGTIITILNQLAEEGLLEPHQA